MKKKVAIFDIDGTIFRSSLLIELVDALIHDGVFPASARTEYIRAYQNWSDRKGAYEKYIMGVVRSFIKHIKGVRYPDFLRVAKKVVAFHQSRVYRYTRDLIYDLKRRGYYLLAISQSPMELVQKFGKKMGFDKMYGRVYEVGKDKKFTGRILYEDLISSKAKVLKRAVAKENLTLRGSVGVGDTESDINFLKMVAGPICFNPNSKLYEYAKRVRTAKGRLSWKIVVERKDVIIEL